MKKLTLPPLPYAYNALEPVISKQIMELHHDKHHNAYVMGANAALDKPEKTREVMRDLSFNYNGAKMHELFWENMRAPMDNNMPGEMVMAKLANNFGSYESFVKEFETAAVSVEGSGWAVLWQDDDGSLTIGQLEKHNLLGLNGAKPILVLDVWEHAYYLQYLNNRAEYVKKWWNVVNWNDVEKRLG